MLRDDSWKQLSEVVTNIVSAATALKNFQTQEVNAKVSYCCIFSRNEAEFIKFRDTASKNGKLAKETETGPVFIIPGIPTKSGLLRILKIRQPDPSRKERGDADFAVEDFSKLKNQYQSLPGFRLIERPEFEMIELVDEAFNARVYFSNPPVEEHSGIKEVLKAEIGGQNSRTS